MWNERFSTPGYLFGTEPADFLRREVGRLSAGQTALCVADGEGRNSVFLAEQGLHVTAMDGSDNAVEKARALAKMRQVSVDFHVADITTWDWAAREYDVVVAIFIQFAPPPMRKAMFAGMQAALRPGGLLVLEGYRPQQVDYGTGGPPHRENMYTKGLLESAFAGMEILHLAEYDAVIEEGEGHKGLSALIDLVARKAG